MRFLSIQQPDEPSLHRARLSVGGTPIERAQWLLKFCQSGSGRMELDELHKRQAEWMVFSEERKAMNAHSVQQVRTTLQRMLLDLVDGKPVEMEVVANRKLSLTKNGLCINTSFSGLHQADGPVHLFFTTLQIVASHFRTCAACKKPYIHEGNWKFCSKRCRWQLTKESYRKKKRADFGGP
jgi:hypothetical protein